MPFQAKILSILGRVSLMDNINIAFDFGFMIKILDSLFHIQSQMLHDN